MAETVDNTDDLAGFSDMADADALGLRLTLKQLFTFAHGRGKAFAAFAAILEKWQGIDMDSQNAVLHAQGNVDGIVHHMLGHVAVAGEGQDERGGLDAFRQRRYAGGLCWHWGAEGMKCAVGHGISPKEEFVIHPL